MRSGAKNLPTNGFEWRAAPPGDYAVIGDPVTHSRSPVMHRAAYEALGLELTYSAIRVGQGEVAEALDHLRSLGYSGVNVTVPHKEEALGCCSEADAFSKRVRAVNTIALEDNRGINTDAPGFMDTIRHLEPSRVLILGAGGSARAIALALADEGWDVSVYNRTISRAEDLVLQLGIDAEIVERPAARWHQLIVNTTSASLNGERVPIDWSSSKPNTCAYDLMYATVDTPFLAEARACGLEIIDGVEMLVAQGARSFEWWTGRDAPREIMREAVRCAL